MGEIIQLVALVVLVASLAYVLLLIFGSFWNKIFNNICTVFPTNEAGF